MKFISAIVAAIALGCLSTAALSQSTAVQWTTESGGNGHWYSVDATLRTWIQAQSGATNRGAHLASFTSVAEQTSAFQLTNFSQQESIWIGMIQSAGAQEPAGGWAWVTGEPTSFSGWTFNNPSDTGGENVGEWTPSWGGGWNDMPEGELRPALLEYSADCNSDGIVDYGQILSGQLADANGNNVPDCCESQSWATVLEYAPNPAVVTVLNLLDSNTVGGRATSENYSAEKAKVANEPAIWISVPRSYNNFRFTVDLSGAPPRRRKCEVLSINLSELP